VPLEKTRSVASTAMRRTGWFGVKRIVGIPPVETNTFET